MEELQMSIIPARREMLEQILQIERDSFSDPWSENAFLTSFDSPHIDFLVCLLGDQVAGYIITLNLPPETEVLNIAVAPRFRRQNIGQFLIREGFGLARARRSRSFYLEVRCSNAPAIALYEKTGFKPMGIRKNYYKNPKEDALVMRYEK